MCRDYHLTVGNFSFNNFGSLVRFKFFTDKPKFSKRTFGLLKLYLALPYNPKPNLILKKPKPPSPSQTIAIDVTRFKKKKKSKLLLLLVACSVPYHSAIIVTHNLMLSLNLFPVTKCTLTDYIKLLNHSKRIINGQFNHFPQTIGVYIVNKGASFFSFYCRLRDQLRTAFGCIFGRGLSTFINGMDVVSLRRN
ncbi:hypothetical protein H5410_039825 [Solanum commersonii]|uniref:Uncharacterized protein n=1 Tax=Solanum commersonii TaxID=4109 RepID=A0A9J5XP92_SOLCO|nr:hypothetical protein H5410_039825 [Solanum commersonii]